MVSSKDINYQRVQTFHRTMDGRVPESPRTFGFEELLHRLDFKLEEIVESLGATAADETEFNQGLTRLHAALDKAAAKVQSKSKPENSQVGQADAFLDLLYLTYGSFVLMGLDPAPIFDIVHAANMGKIWPDGHAHHDPVTNKILKPDNWESDFAPEAKIAVELQRQTAVSGTELKKD